MSCPIIKQCFYPSRVENFNSLYAAYQILLSSGGVIEGNLDTREAVLGGEVHGTVTAGERVEVQATAQLHGDIVTPRLLIQEGGQLNGGIRMESTGEAADG